VVNEQKVNLIGISHYHEKEPSKESFIADAFSSLYAQPCGCLER